MGKQLMEMRDKERLYEFLMGLDKSLGTVKTQILRTRPMVSLGAAFHIVSKDERQKQITSAGRTQVDAATFQTLCSREREIKETKKCTHCGKLYHTIDECYELKGYLKPRGKGYRDMGKKEEPQKKQKSITKGAHMAATNSLVPGVAPKQFLACQDYFNMHRESSQNSNEEKLPTANMVGKINNLRTWIIDSEATEHITCDDGILVKQTKFGTETPVRILNGEKVPVVSVGDTSLLNALKLNGVLNITKFECNLLSVSRLTRDLNCFLTFFPNYCTMQDLPSRTLIGMGRHCDGLY